MGTDPAWQYPVQSSPPKGTLPTPHSPKRQDKKVPSSLMSSGYLSIYQVHGPGI